jgi:tRNA G18 (ribose-2'-O)-methylase SpoU
MEKRHNSFELFQAIQTNKMYNTVSRPIIIADNLRTPENMGSTLRLAGNIGAQKTFFISDIAQQFKNYKINKTASGAADKTSWKVISMDEFEDEIPGDYLLIPLETTKQSGNIFEFHFPEKVAFIIGNEVTGIRQTLLDKAEQPLYIPIPGPVSSLNTTHALSIALFEWYRQMLRQNS